MRFLGLQKGATLLEVLLVVAVVSSITLMGFQVYQNAQKRQQARLLQQNVDQLFMAAVQYYRHECDGSYLAGVFIPGDLNPAPPPRPLPATAIAPSILVPFVLTDITAKLVTPGYLTNWVPQNAFVDGSAANGGYTVQFNPVVSTTAAVNLSKRDYPAACVPPNANCSPNSLPPNATFPSNNQTAVLLWRIQVSVKFLDATQASNYQVILGADCISSLNGIYDVKLCQPVPIANNYLVWERLPSNATSDGVSNLSASTPALKQFKMQYTHDQMYELGAGYQTAIPKYYLCGG